MRSVHRLDILHRIPVVLHKYHGIRSRKRQSKATNVCREQQTVDAGIRIERLHDGMSFVGLGSTVQAHVRNGRHMLFEEVTFNDIQHLLHLTEDKTTVLGERPASRLLHIDKFTLPCLRCNAGTQPDTAIMEELSGNLGYESTERLSNIEDTL